MDLRMGDDRVALPAEIKVFLNGTPLLAMSLWNDDASKALAESFDAVILLDKANLATELIPAIKQYASNGAAPSA